MTQAKMTRRFDARFDDKTVAKLQAICKRTGLTKSEVIRLLVFQATPEQFKSRS